MLASSLQEGAACRGERSRAAVESKERVGSALGTKRNYLNAYGISGAEGRPAVPSTLRRHPPLTQSCPTAGPLISPLETLNEVPTTNGGSTMPKPRCGFARRGCMNRA
jgi:hypothetical protein